jgi:hypothetical protein
VVASGVFVDYRPLGCRLQWAFETDQTMCPSFLRKLDSVAAQLHGK